LGDWIRGISRFSGILIGVGSSRILTNVDLNKGMSDLERSKVYELREMWMWLEWTEKNG
jgi:hypothetical protein